MGCNTMAGAKRLGPWQMTQEPGYRYGRSARNVCETGDTAYMHGASVVRRWFVRALGYRCVRSTSDGAHRERRDVKCLHRSQAA